MIGCSRDSYYSCSRHLYRCLTCMRACVRACMSINLYLWLSLSVCSVGGNTILSRLHPIVSKHFLYMRLCIVCTVCYIIQTSWPKEYSYPNIATSYNAGKLAWPLADLKCSLKLFFLVSLSKTSGTKHNYMPDLVCKFESSSISTTYKFTCLK